MDDCQRRWIVGFRHGPVTLDIGGNDPGDLAWLTEFLLPWCDSVPAGQARVRIRMIRSDQRHQTLGREWTERPAARRAASVPCIRLDRQTIAFEAWSDAAGFRRLFDPETGCFFLIDGARIDVVAAAGNLRARLGLLRLVREAVTGAISASQPVIDLHAAAFTLDDKAIVIAGPKRAGKTSLLCHAITSAGASLVANDRVFLQLGAAGPTVVGIPTLVTIRPGTLEMFPQVLGRAEEFPHLDGAANPSLALSPAGFAGRLGAARVADAPLAAIMLTEIAGGSSGWTLERLSEENASAELEACRYGVSEGREKPTLFGGLILSGLPPLGNGLRHLVSQVPIYHCRLGRGAFDSPLAAQLRSLALETP